MYMPKDAGHGRGMTIAELIERLTELQETVAEDCVVRLMTQENYPFEYSIAGVVDSTEFGDDDEDPECFARHQLTASGEIPIVVYLVEGTQIGYGDRDAWANARRG